MVLKVHCQYSIIQYKIFKILLINLTSLNKWRLKVQKPTTTKTKKHWTDSKNTVTLNPNFGWQLYKCFLKVTVLWNHVAVRKKYNRAEMYFQMCDLLTKLNNNIVSLNTECKL